MKASLKMEGKILKRMDAMIEKGKSPRAFLERVVYPSYLRAQMKRWMSEGRSDGVGSMPAWAPLSTVYKKAKLKRWAAAPGAGTKMLIAGGKLYQAVLDEGPGHRKIVSEKSLIVGIDPAEVPYAKYVNAKRPFFIFSDKFMKGVKSKYAKFMTERT